MAHDHHDAHDGMSPSDRGHSHAGHDKHAGHSVAMFRDKFWISLALTIPTLVWGHMLQRAFGYHAPMFPGAMWIPPVFGTAVFLYGGRVFIQGAVSELKDRTPGYERVNMIRVQKNEAADLNAIPNPKISNKILK